MNLSEWISLGAALLALLAFVSGEVRASRAKKATGERNIIDWEVSWPEPGAFVLTSHGPDEARKVLVRLVTEHVPVEVEVKRVRRGESIRVPVDHIASNWQDPNEFKGSRWIPVSVMNYGLRVTWETPRGRLREHHDSATIYGRRAS